MSEPREPGIRTKRERAPSGPARQGQEREG